MIRNWNGFGRFLFIWSEEILSSEIERVFRLESELSERNTNSIVRRVTGLYAQIKKNITIRKNSLNSCEIKFLSCFLAISSSRISSCRGGRRIARRAVTPRCGVGFGAFTDCAACSAERRTPRRGVGVSFGGVGVSFGGGGAALP